MKKILFLCSPGLGQLDNWAPILEEFKNKKQVDVFFPKIGTLESFSSSGSYFKKLLKNNFFNYYYFSKKKKRIEKLKNINEIYPNYFQLLAKKINNGLIKYFKKEFNFYNFFENKFYSKNNDIIDNLDYSNFLKNYNFICCDATELVKPYLKSFANQSKHICKISMPHGSDFPYYKDYKNIKKNNLGYNFKIILFSKTKEEKNYYQSLFKLKNSNYFRLGNPKHDKKWIKKIINKKTNNYFNSKKKYVFLISRPSERTFLLTKDKIKILKIIKKVIIDEKKYNLVIKSHPKEIYDSYFYDIFNKKLYNKTWKFSGDHPYSISKNAFFSLSFFSGVAIDMNISGTPNIEFLNLKSIKNDNNVDLFFKKNIPMFRIRYLDLTLGVDNKIELEKSVKLVEKNKKKIILFLNKNYYKHYVNTESTKKIIKIFN